MKRALKIIWITVKLSFIVFLFFILSLFFRAQRIPSSILGKICDRLGNESIIISCDGGRFGFREGLSLEKLRVFDATSEKELDPIAHFSRASFNWFTSTVRLDDLSYERLPDTYYLPSYEERSTSDSKWEVDDLKPFKIILNRPRILGIAPEKVETIVSIHDNIITFADFMLKWKETVTPKGLSGSVTVNLTNKKLSANFGGEAIQSQIRPLLTALDIVSSWEYIDAFTQIPPPVPADCEIEVDLNNGDFDMRLHLKPNMGKYRGVKLERADGTLICSSRIRGTNCNCSTEILLKEAVNAGGNHLRGRFKVSSTEGRIRLEMDVDSTLPQKDIETISEFFDDGSLSMLECETSPEINVAGHVGTSSADSAYNNLTGTVKIARGQFASVPFHDVSFRLGFVGERVSIKNITAVGKDGGVVRGDVVMDFPGFESGRGTVSMDLDYAGGTLNELAPLLGFDSGDKNGRVSGSIALTAPIGDDFMAKLNGRGNIKILDGYLMRMEVFAGLTKILAEKIPGIGFLVNQSSASASFEIKDGVLRTEDLLIEGNLFSIRCSGTYDLNKKSIDMTVRVQLLKKGSILGTILSPINWTFSKLLLEFNVKGDIADPKWSYVDIIERVIVQ